MPTLITEFNNRILNMHSSNINLNIDIAKLKSMAKKLKEELKIIGQNITLMESYEIVAKQIGYKNYNTALALMKKEEIGKKTISYTFTFSNDKIRSKVVGKIKDSLKVLQNKNKDFEKEVFDYGNTIGLNLHFNPKLIAYDAMIIDVLLISDFQEYLKNNTLLVEKRDILVRNEITSINQSLLDAINYKQ